MGESRNHVVKDPLCPVCRKSKLRPWGRKNGFALHQCRGCTHIFADIRSFAVDLAKVDDVRRYMTHGALDSDLCYYERLCLGEQEHAHTHITTNLILKDVRARGDFEGKNWLDIGSGSGYLLSRIKELGIEGVGVEPGGWAAIAAKDKSINVIQGLLTEHTFDRKFSYISATDVLEHQSDPYILMRLVKHYVAPGGKAYLSFPFGSSVPARLRKSRWSMVEPPTHCSFFTKRSFDHVVKELGFAVEKSVRYSSCGFRGMSRLGVPLGVANRIRTLLGCGDQVLFVLRPV